MAEAQHESLIGFADRYLHAANSSDLSDEEHQHVMDALRAAALADTAGVGIGPLLAHVEYADGTHHQLFVSGSANLRDFPRASFIL